MSKPTKKEKLDALAHKDISENNWEIPENAEIRPAIELVPEGLQDVYEKETDAKVKKALAEALEKVDPDIRTNNPVWKYNVDADNVIFVFKDGRKVRISLSGGK